MTTSRRAVVLLSGGLDSATLLAVARDRGYDCYALSMAYGQRHSAELDAAKRVAQRFGAADHKVITIGLDAIGGSALTDTDIAVPDHATGGIPVTYVPARNTVFLSLALGWAEVLGSFDIFIGVNAVDYSGYPDYRPEFISAFEHLANLPTKPGGEGRRSRVHAPLVEMTKAEIIRTGTRLGVDYGLTVSCYQADAGGRACGRCDSCRFRRQGFEDAGIADPTRYVS